MAETGMLGAITLSGRYTPGSTARSEQGSRSGARGEPTTGLVSTGDAVNRKAVVAFGRLGVSRCYWREIPLLVVEADWVGC